MTPPFLGRETELHELNKLLKKNSASLIVIQGRRRIGKSRLAEEFAKTHKFLQFSGIPATEKTTQQSQLDEFARQLSIQTTLPEITADDWGKLFLLLSEQTKTGRVIILLDEITWMGSKDPDFLGKLKNAWDLYFKKNPKLILILCGSISAWIEKNILSSTGFLGRVSYRLNLEELPLKECKHFWGKVGTSISAYEKLKVLAVTGGIPRYLEELKPALSAEENIKDLCFTKGAPLLNEFNEMFSDLFSNRSATYKKIIHVLSAAPLEIKEICNELDIERSGFISEYLDDLVKSGFVTRDYTWSVKTGEASRLSHFRLSDNYIRFYLRYIDKNFEKIKNGDFTFKALSLLPNWKSIMGLQFENLVLKNRGYIKKCLGLKPEEIISDNPFFQRKTARNPGCQIDYLLQTTFKTLYVCEIKFRDQPIGLEAVHEMQAKIAAFKTPQGFSSRAVLIHVNGVTDNVIESQFFSAIINFGELLKEE